MLELIALKPAHKQVCPPGAAALVADGAAAI